MIRIAVTGPESTGKSALCRELGRLSAALVVDEYAREYLAEINRPYELEDLSLMAQRQSAMWKKAAAQNPRILIADTEITVFRIWAGFVFGQVPGEIIQLQAQQSFDYYLLCDIDLPWEEDPLREHPDRRAELMSLYIAEMNAMNYPFSVVSGIGRQRFLRAMEILASKGILKQNHRELIASQAFP